VIRSGLPLRLHLLAGRHRRLPTPLLLRTMTEVNRIEACPDSGIEPMAGPVLEPVSQAELNAWRRGFTPQAEIWNGRLAMLGLSVGLTVLLISRLLAGSPG